MARQSQSVDDFEKNNKKEFEFKCCKIKESAIKFCIKCRKPYHNSCLARNKKIKVLSATAIICCDVISPEDKKYNDLLSKFKNLQTYCSGIEKEIKATKAECQRLQSQMETGDSFGQQTDSDNVTLLKKLVEEMTDKNHLLVEKNSYLQQKLKQEIKCREDVSYSGVLKQTAIPTRLARQDSITCLTLKTKYKGNLDEENIKNQLLKKTTCPIISLRRKPCGDFLIKCKDSDAESLKESLDQEIGEDVDVLREEKKNPLILVLGIKSELRDQELISDIVTRNKIDRDNIKVRYVHKKHEKTRNVLLEVSADTYAAVMHKRRIYVGYQTCPVKDDFNLRRCWRCNGYGHSAKNCKRDVACGKCAGPNETRECKKTEEKACVSCLHSNKFSKIKKRTDHMAMDHQECETYRQRWERQVATTNYPFRPELKFTMQQNG